MMNTKFVAATVVALASFAGASAFAQGQNHLYGEAAQAVPPAAFSSSLSRSELHNDYLNARQNGEVAVSNKAAFAASAATPGLVSREVVRSEAAASAHAHRSEGRSVS